MRADTLLNLAIFLGGLLALGLSAVPASAQVDVEPSHEFELREVLSIGDGESAPPERLFANPDHIRTDAAGRIYVVEQRGVRIRVFGSDGTFLGALGRSGGGPGEFKDIQAIAIDSKGRLVVYDRMLQRFTRFPPFQDIDSLPRPSRKVLETFPNPEAYRFTPGFMYGLPNGRFVLYYAPHLNPTVDRPQLHLYNHRFKKVEAFGAPTEWHLPPDNRLIQELIESASFFGGHHVASSRSTLFLTPEFYRGVLYRYMPKRNGTWTLRRVDGRDPTRDSLPYEIVSCDGNWSYAFSGDLCVRRRSSSQGIGQLSDGRLVHLSVLEDEDGILQLQLELFGTDGTLQKVGPIKGFEHDKEEFEAVQQAVNVQLLWVDRRDRLYLEDRRSGFPVIRVMKIEE